MEQEFDGTTSLESLKTALNSTKNLSYTDRYAMRLAAEAYIADEESWPEAIRAVALHESDQRMTDSEKIRKAAGEHQRQCCGLHPKPDRPDEEPPKQRSNGVQQHLSEV